MKIFIATYRQDGTIGSVGAIESADEQFISSITDCPPTVDEPGQLILAEAQHYEMLPELDAFIVSKGKPRKRTQAERRARYEELYKRCLSGELAHRKDNPASILVKWKDEFLPEAYRGTV